MPTVKAMTITVDSLPPRPKYGCDGGYDVAVKGPSVVVSTKFCSTMRKRGVFNGHNHGWFALNEHWSWVISMIWGLRGCLHLEE